MKFLVITNAPTLKEDNCYKAYAPYVAEMDIWSEKVDCFKIISPTKYSHPLLVSAFKNQPIVESIPSLNFTNISLACRSFISLPIIIYKLFVGMLWADHIHLRCPGNIGLLGCLVQVFFPKKTKTVKYAGNWDPKSKQPLSYRFQKWLLSSTFLTKNMQVLVYGKWQNQTKNIKPFFTASFKSSEIEILSDRDYSDTLNFVFVGSLVKGKRPLLAIKIVEKLHQAGKNVSLTLYGDGVLRNQLEDYIVKNKLESVIVLKGNQKKEVIKKAIKIAHFLILASKSEGWPKAIAEAMFFGCIPMATSISCVPYMLDYGKRGLLIEPELYHAVNEINSLLNKSENLKQMSKLASNWSQKYTLNVFEAEIVKLLK